MVAANCRVSEANKLAVGGATRTATGCRVTVAVADFVLSATLVAVTVTVWLAGTEAGAVYKPLDVMDPALLGLMVQVTAVLLLPVTVAGNCCTWPRNMLAVGGATVSATGCRVTVALPDLLTSATLVAITVTVVPAGIEA